LHKKTWGMYRGGTGINRNYAQTMIWYQKALENGDGDAENGIEDLYENGLGVPQDYEKAVE
jgi:TPR repeat protein